MFQFISPCWHHQFMRTMNSISPFIACTLWSFIGCYCDTLLALLWIFLHCFDWERVANWILVTLADQIPYWLRWKYTHMINSFTYTERYSYYVSRYNWGVMLISSLPFCLPSSLNIHNRGFHFEESNQLLNLRNHTQGIFLFLCSEITS